MAFFYKHEKKIALALILLSVFAFNLQAIFGLETLIEDDYARYYEEINGERVFKARFGVYGSIILALNRYLILGNIHTARLVYVGLFAIPLSFCIYYLNRKYFNFDSYTAIFSAIVINILPFQTQIPTFLEGNYPLVGLIFVFLSVMAALEYLKCRKLLIFMMSAILWYISNYLFPMTEYNILMLPSVILLIVIYNEGAAKDKVALTAIFTTISSYKIYMLVDTFTDGAIRNSGTPVSLSSEAILNRIDNLISWSSLLPMRMFNNINYHKLSTALIFIVIYIIGSCIIIYYKKQPDRNKYIIAIIYYFTISVFTILPFIYVSRWMSPRHLYVGFIGIYVIFMLCIAILIRFFFKASKYAQTISFVTLLTVTLIAGIHRQINLSELYSQKNRDFELLSKELKGLGEIKSGSQIAVIGYIADIHEQFKWSSGFYSFCLQQPHLEGILGKEYSFYNPFLATDKAYRRKMGGLDLEKPIYFLKRVGDKYVRPKYFLQWHNKEDKNSIWTVYTIDNNLNLFKEVSSGKGITAYCAMLNSEDLATEEIIWGGFDSARTWTNVKFCK